MCDLSDYIFANVFEPIFQVIPYGLKPTPIDTKAIFWELKLGLNCFEPLMLKTSTGLLKELIQNSM